MFGGVFSFSQDCGVAIAGAVGPVIVNGIEMASNASVWVKPGTVVEVAAYTEGSVAYMAVSGGVDASAGLSVKRGDVLDIGLPGGQGMAKPFRLDQPPSSLMARPLRVMRGPQAEAGFESLMRDGGVVLAERSRVGTRLSGEPVAFEEIPSEPACWGAVQATPNGQRIVIGPDGPTIGGYPKIAAVIAADLDRVAQLREGEAVQFALVEREEAVADSATAIKEIEKRVSLLRALARGV